MTTIKSVTGSHELAASVGSAGYGTYLRIANLRTGEDGISANFSTPALLAALDADPKSVAEGLRVKLAEAERLAHEADVALTGVYERLSTAEAKLANANKRLMESERELATRDEALDECTSELNSARYQRDAHAATIERVRTELDDLRAKAEPNRKHLFEFGILHAAKKVRAALDPKPFVLPTEAGSGIEAERIDGPFKGETQELRLFSDGRWFNSTGHPAWPDDVMSEYTGHRLLDGDE